MSETLSVLSGREVGFRRSSIIVDIFCPLHGIPAINYRN
jgi:hypothetical protein